MVKIRRGKHIVTVTKGAFECLYRPMGYVVIEAEEGSKALPTSDEVVTPPEDEKDTEEDSEDIEEDSEEAAEDTDDIEDEDEDELEEKPISSMNFKELKEFASRHGINVNGLSSKQEVRRAIKEAGI